jgi:hypothetical protein
MRTIVIKIVASSAALLGLLILVGDMPGASLGKFAVVKLLGLLIFLGAARALEKILPEEQ